MQWYEKDDGCHIYYDGVSWVLRSSQGVLCYTVDSDDKIPPSDAWKPVEINGVHEPP